MKLKDNLRFFRRKAGLTQAELAKKMHLRQYNISDYEIGRIEPNIQTLIRFADIFDVSLDFLVGRKTRVNYQSGDDSGVEQDIHSYISTMQIDKYLIDINDTIKDLPEENKKKIAATVAFLVETYTKDN